MKVHRKKTRQIKVGTVTIGGDAPIRVQSMTSTDTRDVKATLEQIGRLADAGCEIVRVAVPDMDAVEALKKITKESPVPIIADIHFHYKLAIESIKAGAKGIRINPGNIGGKERVKEVVQAAKDYGVPIRIGVNSGSVEKDLLEKYGYPSPEAMVESAVRHVRMLEEMDFYEMKISIKSSRVLDTVEANRLLSEKVDYPLHLGVTEAGPMPEGAIKSAVGLGILLEEGIGDTIRVSLTDDPVKEVDVAYEILKSLNLRTRGINIISCPTCGRIEIDVISLTKKVKEKLKNIDAPITVAILGCVVNGPGEAAEADVALAGGRHQGLIYVKGKIYKKVKEEKMVDELYDAIIEYLKKDKIEN